MKALSIYDPPMCCSSGVCGPGADPRLIKLSDDIVFLKSKGVSVQRFNLGHQAQNFTENPLVMREMGQSAEHLPLFVVDGEVKAKGRYPSRRELAAWVGLDGEIIEEKPAAKLRVISKGCC